MSIENPVVENDSLAPLFAAIRIDIETSKQLLRITDGRLHLNLTRSLERKHIHFADKNTQYSFSLYFTVPRFTLAVNRFKAGISSQPTQAVFAELRKLIVQLPVSSRMCINLFLNMVLQPRSLQKWFSQIGKLPAKVKTLSLTKIKKQ